MFNKNNIILLLLIIIIGFSIGFFTGGDREEEAVAETASSGEISDVGPVVQTGGEQKPHVYSFMMLSAASDGHNFDVSKAVVDALGDMNYDTAVMITGSTMQNIEGLLNGQGQLAISNSDTTLEAFNGRGVYGGQAPIPDLRVLMSMWVNYGQLLVRADSDVKSLADLAGRQIAVDEPGSDADRTIRALMAITETSLSEDHLAYVALPDALDGLEQGIYEAVFIVGMLESDRVATIEASGLDVRVIPIDDAAFNQLTALYPFYMQDVLPAGVYASQTEVPTVVTVNVMLIAESVSEDVVYKMLQDFFAQKDELSHKYPILQKALFDEKAAFDIGIPFYTGAAKYYREQGWLE